MPKTPISPAQLRKFAISLRVAVDQGKFYPDDDGSLLEFVENKLECEGMLDDIEKQYPALFNALIRCEEDYVRQVETTQHTECSLDAIDAFVALVAKGGMPAAEDDGDDDDDDGDDDAADPDADLSPERN